MFNIGDRIIFKHPKYASVTGTVAKVIILSSDYCHVLMYPDEPHPVFSFYEKVGGKYVYRFEEGHCFPIQIDMGPPLPAHIKQQRAIEAKCKNLWNKSNFVKKHPAFAY